MLSHTIHQLLFRPDFVKLLSIDVDSSLHSGFALSGAQLPGLHIYTKLSGTTDGLTVADFINLYVILLHVCAFLNVLALLHLFLVVLDEDLVILQLGVLGRQVVLVHRVELVGHLPVILVQAQRDQHQD